MEVHQRNGVIIVETTLWVDSGVVVVGIVDDGVVLEVYQIKGPVVVMLCVVVGDGIVLEVYQSKRRVVVVVVVAIWLLAWPLFSLWGHFLGGGVTRRCGCVLVLGRKKKRRKKENKINKQTQRTYRSCCCELVVWGEWGQREKSRDVITREKGAGTIGGERVFLRFVLLYGC